MPDGPLPVYVFRFTAYDAEIIARSREAIQRSCELLRSTEPLTSYLDNKQRYDPAAPTDDPDGEAEC